ncbi:coiled-coil domain-containing protein 148 isoform X1 [Coregonus clupeaformis]|uniref:coiled-coil domain-containing protein 148 isoform X1 n=1 Tax=Coregonus clupeaformis TaxID=59861 RepID=UPI001E1C80C5|nr:coiled-coil domain-containing protein 148 isoform X1 [Coregonus clupeaformis]XP_041720510.2 coiled-coil domain-containing protein 148 isoform X1 [Coregonus clupeaformis]
MSGRDLHGFITNCRTEDLEKLTLRMKDGLGSSKYKPAEYEKLHAIVDAKRLQSAHIAQKVKRTLRAAKETKESSLLRQHRQVWSRENIKLANAGEKAEAELQGFLRPNGLGSRTDKGILSELLDHELLLESELEAFRCATVEPIWQLRDDLQYRLTEVQHQQHHQPPQLADWEKVLHQVNFVKDQQDAINEKLHTEYLAIEEDILSLGVEESSTKTADCLVQVDQVPEEVLYLDCPYPGLTASLIQEFQSLSEKYQSRLQSVQDRLQGLDRFCGWLADDHLRFQMTVSQYPHDLHNHRALYMDMLQRLFPHRSRQELINHKLSWDWQRFTQTQLRVVAQSWQRDRADLLFKVLVTLEEARQAYQEELALHTDRQHQQEICSRLSDKLKKWRAHQEEVARLEAAIAGRQQEEEEDRLRREQERDSAMRSLQKEKVKQYYAEKQRRREELERRDQQRLTELRRLMAEQANRDKERVQFREEALLQRREEREAQALQRLKEEEERGSRLEALRNQVAVVAEPDPERMMGDTEAWRGRLAQQSGEEEFRLHRPLYHLNTYTDSQIVSDPRVRIEQALRAAGLHNTLYAKEVLSVVQPPRPPRRDTDSIGFKSSTKSV